jgi:hypothetical protein
VEGAVRPHGVVGAAEGVELALQFDDGVGAGLRGQPVLLGPVEAFNLAAGLRVVGPGVGEDDAAGVQGDLEGDPAAAAVAAGEDGAVVGEHAVRAAAHRGPPAGDGGRAWAAQYMLGAILTPTSVRTRQIGSTPKRSR